MFLILLLAVITLIFIYVKWSYSYWQRNSVPCPEPTFFVGNVGPTLTMQDHLGNLVTKWYKWVTFITIRSCSINNINLIVNLNWCDFFGFVCSDYPNVPYFGYYKILKPGIVLRDPELIKDVLIKNFNSVHENDVSLSRRYDPLLVANPFLTNEDEWRRNRNVLTVIFSLNKVCSDSSEKLWIQDLI